MTRQQELTEVLLEYLSDPDFEISSISLRVKDKVLSLNFDNNVFSILNEPFYGFYLEDTAIYGGGKGLRSILETMKTRESTEK